MDTLKRFQTSALIGAGAVVVCFVLFLAVVSPQGHKLSSLRATESQLQSQQTQLQTEIATLKRDKAQMAQNCAQLNKALTEIPGKPNVDSFLQQVTALAVASGDPNTPTINYTSGPPTSGVTPIQITMTLQGNYGQMSAFIKGLDTFPRLFTISSMSVNGGAIAAAGGAINPGTTGYNLSLTGSIYYSLGQQDLCTPQGTLTTSGVAGA
jgi:Tfp pilus assembly protein PilO